MRWNSNLAARADTCTLGGVIQSTALSMRESWKVLTRSLRDQRRGLGIAVLIGVVWSAAKIAVPRLTQLAIDRGIAKRGPLWGWALLIVLAGMVSGLFTALRRYAAFNESRELERRLRDRLYEHVIRLHIGYHDRAQTGQLMSRASSDMQQIQGFVVMIPLTVSNLVLVIGVVVVLIASQPMLAIIALSPLPLINLLSRRFSLKIHPTLVTVQQRQAQLATVVEESVTGVRVIKGFGAEDRQEALFTTEAEAIRTNSLNAARIRSAFLPGIDVLPALGQIAVLGIGGHRVLNGQMTIGELVAFNIYVALMIQPLRTIGMTVAFGQRAAAALVRVGEVLATNAEITSPDSPTALPAGPGGHVRFNGLRFGYDPDEPILDGFDLEVPAGQSVALVGATGSGKSTVARLLLRFYDPQAGSITLDGAELHNLDLDDLRHNVSVVFEDTFLFSDSVRANIAFARPDAPMADVERAAELAGAAEFVAALPEGYDSILGERGYSLSGGQRQRIAIARAILADPRVLILDDATSAVDPAKEHEIRDALATVMHGRTTIVIAHRPATIALADRVVLIDGGKVAASGPHQVLIDSNERYREVLAAWAARDAEETDDAPDAAQAVVG